MERVSLSLDARELDWLKQWNTNTFKYHVFAPMGRFQLELIYLYFPPSSISNSRLSLSCRPFERPTGQKQPTVRRKDGGK